MPKSGSRFVLFVILFLFSILLFSSINAQPNGEGLVLGKTYRIQSKILNEERQIYVYLPEGYRVTDDKYPVAYLMDGYEHFHYTSGIIKSLAENNKIPQMIVIGVLNVDRYRDFTPYPLSYFPNSGKSENFLKFLQEELFPFVDKYYRAEPHRLLIGHSLGGLFAINTLAEHPGIFNAYIAPSPALLHIDSVITEAYPDKFNAMPKVPCSLYFTIGGEESGEIINCTTNFRDILLRCAPNSLDWDFKLMENENHTSLTFSSIYEGLLHVYSNWQVPLTVAKDGFESIVNHYADLSTVYGYDIPINVNLLNSICKNMINYNILENAVGILKRATELFPKAASIHNNLGVAYERNGQLEEAEKAYKNACDKAAQSRDPYFSIYVENLNNLSARLRKQTGRINYEPQLL